VLSRLGYVSRETATNLRRNLTLTFAALVTVIVSLLLVGTSFLIQKAVDHALQRWSGGVEFIVFMNPDATTDQIAAVQRDLQGNPQVDKTTFFTKDQAYKEFLELFPHSPELTQSLTAADMPTSFRVVPKVADSAVIKALGGQYEKKPGVLQVEYSQDTVNEVRAISDFGRAVALGMAAVLLAGTVMLVWNTIRTAMFARRREIEVMKLVGATDWFIRIPFMVEGLITGLAGAVVACFGLIGVNWLWNNKVIPSLHDQALQALVVSSGQVRLTCVILLVLGAVLGSVGSGIAVTRFLDV
jgi:cell division transport system permease protein